MFLGSWEWSTQVCTRRSEKQYVKNNSVDKNSFCPEAFGDRDVKFKIFLLIQWNTEVTQTSAHR